MSLIASDTGGGMDFDPVEAGVHHAVCYGVVDLLTQHNPKFDQWQKKCLIMFELPNLRIEVERDGEKVDLPKVISRQFTVSLSEKSLLRPFLESWRGRPFSFEELSGFAIEKLLGVNCQLNIIHAVVGDKTYANIAAAMPLGQGMQKRQNENEYMYYSYEDNGLSIPEGIYDWVKEKIMKSKEWNETGQQNDEWGDNEPPQEPPADYDDSDIPF